MSEVREGYKMTELGEIPSDWGIYSLEEVLDIRDGTHDSPKYIEKGIPFVTSKNLRNGKLDFTDVNYISETDHKHFSNRSLVENGDILFGMIGTVGNPVIVDLPFEISIKNVALIKFSKFKIINKFVLEYLNSSFVLEQFRKFSNGGVQKFIALGTIRKLKILVPSFEEQQKIASILSTVDEQIDETEQLIVKTKQLKKGLMQQLLTKGIGHTEFKQTELGEIPLSWECKKFEEVMILQRGYDLPSQNREEGEVPILSANGISGYHNEAKVKGPGIVTGRSGTIGKVHYIEEDFWALNTSLYVKEMYNNHPKFLFYLLSDFGIEKYSTGTGVPTLNRNDVHKVLIAVPSSIEEQQKIASILSTVDEQIEVYEEEKAKYEELKKGLMQQLLTGQIRVKI